MPRGKRYFDRTNAQGDRGSYQGMPSGMPQALGLWRLQALLEKGEFVFGSHKVKIEGELLEKVKQCSDAAGYESIDEFVIHMLEKETNKILPPEESNTSKEDI